MLLLGLKFIEIVYLTLYVLSQAMVMGLLTIIAISSLVCVEQNSFIFRL